MKKRYKFLYFDFVKKKNENEYEFKQSKEQIKKFKDDYLINITSHIDLCIPKESEDRVSYFAKFAQLLGANTKRFRSELSYALCSVFFEIYEYDKTYHSAQNFIFDLTGKKLTREIALKEFSNVDNLSGNFSRSESSIFHKKNKQKVEENKKEFLSMFPYKSISYSMDSVINEAKELVKNKAKK